MKPLVLYVLSILSVLPCVYGQQAEGSLPITIVAATRGLVISDSPTCYLDSINTTRGGSIQDVATVRDKSFAVPWARFLDLLTNKPRPYVFWLQAGLRNDSDSALDLSLGYGNLDFVDTWLLPERRSRAAQPGNPATPPPVQPRNRANGLPASPATPPQAANVSPPATAQPTNTSPPMAPQYGSDGALRASPSKDTYLQRQSNTIPLTLPPHTNARLLIRVRQLTDDYHFDGFALFDAGSLGDAFVKNLSEDNAFLVIQMLFQGFLLCQLLYVLVQWFIIRRPEYLYYFLYMLLIAGYFLSKQESLFGVKLLFTRWPTLRIYLGKTLLVLPYYVYFRFIRSFLDFPRDYPRLNYWIIRLEYFLLAYAVLDFLYIVLTFNRGVQTVVYTTVFSIVFFISIGFTIYLIRYRQPLVYFILAGSIIVATGHILGLVFSYLEYERHLNLGVPDIFVFPQCGIVLEILCFTAGLSYKNRKIEKEKIAGHENLIEQLKANELLQSRMQHIRNKIAQDLHDDIGSTLSSISILSDLAIHGNNSDQAIQTINEIKDSSLMLMERMDDIVWSINPRNDSLENLLMRVRHFATTLFEARGIEYTIDIQKNINEVRIPMEYRQHIYLILKEAINNLVKYAGATEAFIDVRFDQHYLTLAVRDNGCGFDPGNPAAGSGNGISGMQHRAGLMNARVDIATGPGQGTAIRLQVDLV
ncbi:MAG TPA: 7TM diverse intracellular signaling domain-containing protein [Puia sp.]|nr:7TM diverse intracellular signaling domain-containing protein [Puia sp.]